MQQPPFDRAQKIDEANADHQCETDRAQINSVSQLKALAREGRGQTILPRVALASELAEAARQIRSIEPAVKLRSYIATTANPGNRIREVKQILRDVVERLIRTGDWPGAVMLQ